MIDSNLDGAAGVSMRIMHVITTISRGGAENQLVGLVARQRAAGHEVKVAYMKQTGYWRKYLEALGAQVADLKARFNADPAAAWRLRKEIAAFRPTLVNAHLQPAELCARVALLGIPASKLPMVITRHNLNPFCGLPGERFLGRWVARRASGIIAVSDSTKARCARSGCAAAAGRATTIHNAIDAAVYEKADPAAVAAARRQWGAAPEDYVIGTAARLLPLKAIDVLIRGFAEYLAHAKLQAKLVVVGAGPQGAQLKDLAASLGLGERVVFAGFREDMAAVMNAFDVFALTSHTEAFGLVVLEAMAAGKPVVATAVGGIPELLDDRAEGLLIPPRQPPAVAQALAALEDRALRERLGAAGRHRVKSRHGQDAMCRRTMEFYEECLA